LAKGASDKSELHVNRKKTSYKMFAKIKTAGSESQCKVEQIAGDNLIKIDGRRAWQVAGDGDLVHTAFHYKEIPESALELARNFPLKLNRREGNHIVESLSPRSVRQPLPGVIPMYNLVKTTMKYSRRKSPSRDLSPASRAW
jgi:hypothetical protein